MKKKSIYIDNLKSAKNDLKLELNVLTSKVEDISNKIKTIEELIKDEENLNKEEYDLIDVKIEPYYPKDKSNIEKIHFALEKLKQANVREIVDFIIIQEPYKNRDILFKNITTSASSEFKKGNITVKKRGSKNSSIYTLKTKSQES